VLALYRAHLGGVLVPVAVEGTGTVDAVASLDREAGVVALGLVNFSPHDQATLGVRLDGGYAPGRVEGWRIDGPSLDAMNVPGEPEAVTTTPLAGVIDLGALVLPPHSVTLIRLES
jgi:alpha-L-arabinofuranosidase